MKMDNLVVLMVNGRTATRYEHFGESIPKFVNTMRTWDKAGVLTVKSNAAPKVADKGKVCIIVGYSDMHAGD